jgi:hypothetical protein
LCYFAHALQFPVKSLARGSKLSFGSLLIALVLLLNALAASPKLHELLHPDAGQAQHQCAVTLFAHGQVDSAIIDLPPAAVVASIQLAPRLEIPVFAPAIENLPAGRAPPVSVSSPV